MTWYCSPAHSPVCPSLPGIRAVKDMDHGRFCAVNGEPGTTSPVNDTSYTGDIPVAIVTLVDRPYLVEAVTTLDSLHMTVTSTSWAVVGGLMVQLLCAEAGVEGSRATEDADLAVDVFDDRSSLRSLTDQLLRMGFYDGTPDSTTGDAQKSYRWVRDGLKIDFMVPQKMERQRFPARTATGKPAVEFPAVQQAVQRSELVEVRVIGTSVTGRMRRPNLAGAIVIKAVAGVADKRDTQRHWEDLALLGQICADHPDLPAIRDSLKPDDRKRIRKVLKKMFPSNVFSRLENGEESAAALDMLAAPPRR